MQRPLRVCIASCKVGPQLDEDADDRRHGESRLLRAKLTGMNERVLVTGATGFVGRMLCDVLAQANLRVRAAVRDTGPVAANAAEKVAVGDITGVTDWEAALTGVDFVVHLAARAHVLGDLKANDGLYFETNAEGTRKLADSCTYAGVRRFVYLSSIKVNGEYSGGHGFTPDDEPRPADAYGRSKWLGEQYVADVAARSGLETVIVRAPLVYGPGVKANFLRMLQWVDRGRPLPLSTVVNQRSLVSLWNLCDLLMHVLSNRRAHGRTWMVSDGEDLSTPELIRRIARAMNRKVRLLPVPSPILQLCAGLFGYRAEAARLCGSLTVDLTQTRNELGWSPPVTTDRALARTVAWYLADAR
jgi:nucleoside-diphosphate-sugar epimerase